MKATLTRDVVSRRHSRGRDARCAQCPWGDPKGLVTIAEPAYSFDGCSAGIMGVAGKMTSALRTESSSRHGGRRYRLYTSRTCRRSFTPYRVRGDFSSAGGTP
jgi:hypothetical protein